MVGQRTAVDGILMLEDGTVFEGRLAVSGRAFGEVVFNTSMTGYQEVITDPSYCGQIVLMTQPHIGNYGADPRHEESARPWVEALVARELTTVHSGSGSGGFLEYLHGHGLPALDSLDTRAVVRRLREHGSMRGVVASADEDREQLLEELRRSPSMAGRALVDQVTCAAPFQVPAQGEERCHLAVYDFGVKSNILRCLARAGARCTVLPARTGAAECLALDVDGIVLSNGPGDPEPLDSIIATVGVLVGSGLPMLGICLGHQLVALALGGRTYKLKFGHHGGNQPVLDVDSGTVAITSQNHGFAVDPDSLPPGCRVTAINLNDRTVEGFAVEGRPVFSVQYHPEAAPGPHDASYLFGRFLDVVTQSAGAGRIAQRVPAAEQPAVFERR
jgi:carbamoyl-phosphate synthase small subunit